MPKPFFDTLREIRAGAALHIGYELIRPERVLETKFAEICAQVAATGWTVLQATRK